MRFFRRTPKTEEPVTDTAVAEAEPGATAEPVEAAGSPDTLSAEDAQRTDDALQRTRRSWFSGIADLFERGDLDETLWENLEELLIGADTGVGTTQNILEEVRGYVADERVKTVADTREVLKDTLVEILEGPEAKGKLWTANGSAAARPKPAVILVLGVNGSGKTTTIAKLAHACRLEGGTAVIAAGDTFRAAAIEQLREWGERVGADVIAHKQGADPGAVVYDALVAAESRNADVVIIDTAGRLHTKFNLMEELRKVRRVIERKEPSAPHEVLLVLDATTGQNALIQAKAFTEAADVTAVCLTKLDGTAKGGIVFAIAEELGLPIRWVGTGERAEDLAPFSPEAFVEALFRS